MPNPIDTLKGEVVTNPLTPLPEPQQAAFPVAPPPTELPVEVNKGLMPPVEPETLPPPPQPFVQFPEASPAFEAQKLQAPAKSGNEQALDRIGPTIQQGIQGMRFEQEQTMEGAMSPNAVDAPRTWETPDLEGSITRFGYNSSILSESFKRQVASRSNESERAWLERNMAAIEAMAQPSNSPTANSMDWVSQMLGASTDGGRQYAGAAYYDKSAGEWKGSPVGAVLYGLGILQNSAIGAYMDVTNMFQNLDSGMRSAYEAFTPPWAKGSSDSMMSGLDPLLKGGAFHTPGVQNRTPGGKRGTYNDGKSNFIEALRGAQYSFSDKAETGLGLNNDKGFRLSFDINDYIGTTVGGKGSDPFNPKPKFVNPSNTKGAGIDINPGVIAGVAIDVILGGKVDKLFGKAATKLLPKRTLSALNSVPTSPSLSSLPAPAATRVPQFIQGNIPFPSGPVKTAKAANVALPANLKVLKVKAPAKPPKTDVQQVLPIADMMEEFDTAYRVMNPKAYMPGVRPNSKGQLSLRLEGVEITPYVHKGPLPKVTRPKSQGRQLALFDSLPEAVPPKISIQVPRAKVDAILGMADDTPMSALPPEVINQLEAATKNRLSVLRGEMENSPDIGRRFATTPDIKPSLPVPQGIVKLPDIKAQRIDLGNTDLFHGTQVKGLDFNSPALDPTKGGAYSELGTGIYVSADEGVARLAAGAQVSAGLPTVAGREFVEKGGGTLHTLRLREGANIIDGTKPIAGLDVIANRVGAAFPTLSNANFSGKSLTQIYDTAALLEPNPAARLAFQQRMAVGLRDQLIDGVKVGDNIAIYSREALESSVNSPVFLPKDHDYLKARADLEDWGATQVESEIAKANAMDSEAAALGQYVSALEQRKREAMDTVFKDIKLKGLMDQPSRIPSLDESTRLTLQTLYQENPLSKPAGLGALKVTGTKEIAETSSAAMERLIEVARKRGITVRTGLDLPKGVGGYYQQAEKALDISKALDGAPFWKFETTVHELAHHEVNRLLPYTPGAGVTINEAVVDSVASTVTSLLMPKANSVIKNGFDSFFQTISTPKGVLYDGVSIPKNEVLEKYGELARQISKDLLEELMGADFKPPALRDLNLFSPAAYDDFVTVFHGKRKTLAEAVNNHIVTIDPLLDPTLQLRLLATNPVSGKINDDVLRNLSLQFSDEVGEFIKPQPTSSLRKWAEGYVENSDPLYNKRKVKAKEILDEISAGGTDYDGYLERLTKLGKADSKTYVPRIRAEIDEYVRVTYCS